MVLMTTESEFNLFYFYRSITSTLSTIAATLATQIFYVFSPKNFLFWFKLKDDACNVLDLCVYDDGQPESKTFYSRSQRVTMACLRTTRQSVYRCTFDVSFFEDSGVGYNKHDFITVL